MPVDRPTLDDGSLRRYLRDLVAVSTLSAAWSRREPKLIAQSLADVICRSLPVVVTYVRLGKDDANAVEAAGTASGALSQEHVTRIGTCVRAVADPETGRPGVDLFGDQPLHLSITPIGLDSEFGIIAVGSRDADFPSSVEQLLLSVPANQAAVVLQQRQMQTALRDSEAMFRSIADNAPALLWMTDAAGQCTYLSKQWYDFTNRAPAQDLGLGWLENVHPDDGAEAGRIFQDANQRHVAFSINYRLRRHDGEYRWAVDTGNPRFDRSGRFIGFVGAVIDVHESKLGEGRLRMLWEAAAVLLAAEDPDVMLRGLFETVGQHIAVDAYFNYLVDENANTLRLRSYAGIADDAARSIERLEFGQSICGTVAELQRPIVVTHIQQSDDPKAQFAKGFGMRAYACNPLVVDGQLIGTLSFASRSQDAFKAEEIAVLETISHNVTIAYERIRLVEKLKEADRRKDEFLATLAHELRNPLAPVLNSVAVIRQSGTDSGLIDRATAIMDRQLSHMVRLIDDLLDAARITTGKLELRKTRVELSTLLMNAVEANRPILDQMGHELRLALPPMIHIYGDSVRLTQVVSNLLNNAAKYTDKGGRIVLGATQQGNEAVISIKDSGVGIPAGMQARIFDTFAQVDRSLTRSQGGLGLGLTLVKRLIEMHGGTVSVQSDGPGTGSEFTIRLPLAQEHDAANAIANGEVTKDHVRLSVLVVDDNLDGAESLATILRLQGNDVLLASDGHEALRIAESARPEVVILDIGLPGLDGYEVARRIRKQPWGTGMLLVAVSGWGQPEDKRRSVEAGLSYHLVKPVNPFDIGQLLADHGASINGLGANCPGAD